MSKESMIVTLAGVTLALVAVNLYLTYRVASGLQSVTNVAQGASTLLSGFGL